MAHHGQMGVIPILKEILSKNTFAGKIHFEKFNETKLFPIGLIDRRSSKFRIILLYVALQCIYIYKRIRGRTGMAAPTKTMIEGYACVLIFFI